MNKIFLLNSIPAGAPLDEKDIRSIVSKVLDCFRIDHHLVEISFVSKLEIQTLNRDHRQIDKPTDVLSFPQAPIKTKRYSILGSLVINLDMVNEKAENLEDVIKHGLLHLLGFDHESDQIEWDEAAKNINCQL